MLAKDPENFVEEEYSVPDEMVGLIIGRGGAEINRLATETGCRIQMSPRSNGDPNRRCTLSGSQESVGAAKSKIKQMIRQSGRYVKEIMIPGLIVGRLIGKGGENLRQLQEKCGVKMTVIQEGPEPTIYAKPLRISGEQENVEYAEQMVDDFLSQWNTKQAGYEHRAPWIEKKVSQRVFASLPVYREDLVSNQEQDDRMFPRWLIIVGMVILLLIICSPGIFVGLVILLLMIYLMKKTNQ